MAETAPRRNFACDRCSRRKQRCDKAVPTCTQCLQAGSACVASSIENNIVQLNDKEVARKGYVTALEEQIASLEAQVRQRGLPVDADLAADSDVGSTGNDEEIGATGAPRLPSPHLQTRSPFDGTNTYMSSLSLSAMAEPQSRAGEFLKHLSMPRIIAGMTETYGGNPEVTARVDSLWDGIAKDIRHPTGLGHRLHIQRAEAIRALETYLEVVDFRFPRLPRAKVQSGIDAITASDERDYYDAISKKPAHIFMAYMVIAIVPLVSDKYPISQGSFVSLHILAKCLKVLDRVFSLEDGLDIIQCIHLLVIFAMHCSAAGSAWHLSGFAMNKCIALGYHRECSPANLGQNARDEIEQRRWAFWGCYLLDRLICSALDRPFAIDDRYITVSLPGIDANGIPGNTPIHEAFHIHYFRYAQLLSMSIRCPAPDSFDSSLGHLLYWRSATPPHDEPQIKQAFLQQTSLFHMLMLRTAVMDLLASFAFRGNPSGIGEVQYLGRADLLPSDYRTEYVINQERKHVKKLRLIDICRSVARSLDRTRMTSRHYLSLTTGYYALVMALATLYFLVVMGDSCVRESPLISWSNIDPSNRNISQGRTENVRRSSETAAQRQSRDSHTNHAEVDALLDVAAQKLEVVSRQFPRMQDYRQTVQLLRCIITKRINSIGYVPSQDEMDDARSRVMAIGPEYLRHLAQAVIFLI